MGGSLPYKSFFKRWIFFYKISYLRKGIRTVIILGDRKLNEEEKNLGEMLWDMGSEQFEVVYIWNFKK